VAEPLSVYVDDYGTGAVAPEVIEKAIRESISLTPRGIKDTLGLTNPIYRRTAAYGHFGRAPDSDGGFSWEKTDLADALKAAAGRA
jgi:S-adenosylmethionine synthetase